MAEKIIRVEPGGSSGMPGRGRALPVENFKPKNNAARGAAIRNAPSIPQEFEFLCGWTLRQLISKTKSSPAKPSHTIHPASEMGLKYARLSNSVARNCIWEDYSVNPSLRAWRRNDN